MADVPLTPQAPAVPAADPNALLRNQRSGDLSVVDRESGRVLRVDAQDAAAGFAEGRYTLPSTTQRVWMVSPHGNVGEVDANEAGAAMGQDGFRFATRDEQLKGRAESDKSTAFVEGLARSVTGGLTDVAAQQAVANLGVDESVLDDYRARAETGAATAGNLAGFVAGVLGGDAATVATRGLAGLIERTAAGQAARAAVESGAQKALGTILSEQTANAAVRGGLGRMAQASTEGALYGVGGKLSEQALGPDPHYNVQELAAAGLMGGLIGSAADAAFFVPGLRKELANKTKFGRGVTPISEEAILLAREAGGVVNMSDDAIAGAVARLQGEEVPEAAKGLLGRMFRQVQEKVIDPVAAAGSGLSAAELRDLASKKNMRFVREGAKGVEQVGRQLKGALDDMYKMGEADSKLAFNQLRPHLREEALRGAGTPEVVGAMGGAVNGLRNQLDELVMAAPGMTVDRAKGVVAPFRQELERMQADAWKAAGVKPHVVVQEMPGANGSVVHRKVKLDSFEDLAERSDADLDAVAKLMYDRLDRVKNFVAKPGRFGDDLAGAAERELQSKFQDMHANLRGHLEDEAVFGSLGTAQRELNQAARARLDALDELQKVFKFNKGEADPSAIMSHLNALKGLRGDRGVAALDAFVAAQNRFAQVVEKNFDGVAMSAPTKAMTERMAAIREELANRVRVVNVVNDMVNAENQRLGGGMMFGGALAGAVYGGVPGAAMGYLAGGMLRPGRQLMMRAHMGSMLDNVRSMVKQRVAGAVDDAGEVAAKAKPSPELLERGLSRATIKMLQGSPQERRDAYKERVAQLDRLADPQGAAAASAPTMRALQPHAPLHSTIASVKAAEAVQALRNRLPGVNPGRNSFDPLEPATALQTPDPTDRDIERFARADAVATNPMRIILDPHVTPDEVKVAEELYPDFVANVRAQFSEFLAAKKKPLTKRQRAHAATVMGVHAYKPERIAKWQSLYKVPIPGGGAGATGSTPRTSKNPRSASMAPLSDQATKR